MRVHKSEDGSGSGWFQGTPLLRHLPLGGRFFPRLGQPPKRPKRPKLQKLQKLQLQRPTPWSPCGGISAGGMRSRRRSPLQKGWLSSQFASLTLVGSQDGKLYFHENNLRGELVEQDGWLVAELPPAGARKSLLILRVRVFVFVHVYMCVCVCVRVRSSGDRGGRASCACCVLARPSFCWRAGGGWYEGFGQAAFA